MEIRRITICMALFVLAISQCSDAHSMRRRQAVDDVNYDDPLLGDEATDDETMNDTDGVSEPQPEKTPAVIETAPTQYEVAVGGHIRLECKVQPEKGTVVQWHRNNQSLFIGNINLRPSEVRYSIVEDSKDLLIRDAQVADSGVFRCSIAQKVPVAVDHTLMVIETPKIINMSVSYYGDVRVGEDLKLTCYITGTPVPTVLWSVTRRDRPNERLTEKDGEFKVEGNLYSLYIKNLKREHSGQYYCYALNKAGSDQNEKNVVVRGKPQVHVKNTVVNSDIQIEAVLECAAHDETGQPLIRWYKDGVLIEDSASKYSVSTEGAHSNLTVSPSADEDFGTFTCEAENGYGSHKRSIELVQRPVVEHVEADGARLAWRVASHQPLEDIQLQLRPTSEDGEWRTLQVPVPTSRSHKYELSYTLDDKQLSPGQYLAVVKVKNSKSWGSSYVPAVVNIDYAQPQYIQTASVSVFSSNDNGAHSIRPVSAVISSVLMYLLVRML